MVTEYNTNFILEIQNYFVNIKNLYPSLPAVKPTGVYDEATHSAVLAFQNLKGLSSAYFIDVPTLSKLVIENNEYLKRTQTTGRIPASSPYFADVKMGAQRDIVYIIKIMLNHFNRRYINYTNLEVTNFYDEETKEAVMNFQQRSMLPVTGIVDKTTWNTLVQIYDTCRFYKEM